MTRKPRIRIWRTAPAGPVPSARPASAWQPLRLAACALVTLLGLPSLLVEAQGPPPGPPLDEMRRLSFLEGEWKGSGWMEWAPGQRARFTSWELVEPRLGGRILSVEGRHHADIPGSPEPALVHHAFGIFSHQNGGYRFRTWLANGQDGDFEARLEDGRLIWGYRDPRLGQVRYTISLSDAGDWVEVGERAGDDDAWSRFFEMRLTRVR